MPTPTKQEIVEDITEVLDRGYQSISNDLWHPDNPDAASEDAYWEGIRKVALRLLKKTPAATLRGLAAEEGLER